MVNGSANVLLTDKGATITVKVSSAYVEANREELKAMHMEPVGIAKDLSSINAGREDLLKNIFAQMETLNDFIRAEAQQSIPVAEAPGPTLEPDDGEDRTSGRY